MKIGSMDSIQLVHDMGQWRASLKKVMKFQVP
jgi:hypothetical protein